ncbi:MAG: tetratricopeptide repeat protein [Planctomycetota bacterium]|jgi:tetratricopeptide (TPR) repeat protein|nr:tetratricopeptide repeat protein [Planctomycetota bacterium]
MSGFVLAFTALATIPDIPIMSGKAAAGEYYCPPGAKFCPAPGADNSIYLDTHFGMDAETGEVRAYRGTVHPDEASSPPPAGEVTLYSAPAPLVESRFVPNPAHPGVTPSQVREGTWVSGRRRNGEGSAMSEVADQQTGRTFVKRAVFQGETRVPWYKGGWWRNRKSGGGAGSRPAASQGKSSNPPPIRKEDDFWGDEEEYDNYAAQPGAGDPYAQPMGMDSYARSSDGYSPQSQPESTGGFVGDPYTLPNSPPPTSPYQPEYVYPGTQYSAQGGYSRPAYAAPPGTPYSSSASGGGFLPPPPAEQRPGAQPNDAGSPEFQNAIRLVKSGRYNEAKSVLQAETARNPSGQVWRWLGDCQYNLLELESAIASYARALELDPNDYYAMRGQGFALLHRGHEYWRSMQEAVARGDKTLGAEVFAQAHDNYKRAFEQIGFCLRRAPNDSEAIYGEAMAAEGASRKVYSNAVSYLKLGPDPENRQRAELFAENCLTIINKGIERSRERARLSPGESGPRALLGGLYLRKAMLYHNLGKRDLALIELKNARDVQQSILDEIDKNNVTAQKSVRECESYWESWGGDQRQL